MNPAKKVLINPYTSDNYCSNMEVRLILVVEEHPWLLQYSQPVEDGNTHTHTWNHQARHIQNNWTSNNTNNNSCWGWTRTQNMNMFVKHSSACLVAPRKVLINSLSRSLASLHDTFFSKWASNQRTFTSDFAFPNHLGKNLDRTSPNAKMFVGHVLGVVGFIRTAKNTHHF